MCLLACVFSCVSSCVFAWLLHVTVMKLYFNYTAMTQLYNYVHSYLPPYLPMYAATYLFFLVEGAL